MKKLLLTLLSVLLLTPAEAQSLTIRDVFSSMPDSLLPTLTKNNRLDLIDFFEAKMKAEVTNRLEGSAELLALSSDSLSLRTSKAQTVTLYLISTEMPYDSLRQVVCMERRLTLADQQHQETVRTLYTLKWRVLDRLDPADEQRLAPLPTATLLEGDERVTY